MDLHLVESSSQRQENDDESCNAEFSEGLQTTPIQEGLALVEYNLSVPVQEIMPLMDCSHTSPVFRAVGSFMRADADATLHHMKKFLTERFRSCSEEYPFRMSPVVLHRNSDQGIFTGLYMNHLLHSRNCFYTEKTIFLRLLIGLSYRKTQDHAQTKWLISNMTSPAEKLFWMAQLYGDSNTDQQQCVCRALLQDLDKRNLPAMERQRQKALLHDTLGILQVKDPQETDKIVRMQEKKRQHDLAKDIRQNLLSSPECDPLDKVLILLDHYTSLQSAGYARARLSCKDALSSTDRIMLAEEAKTIHSHSICEQQRLLNMLGISPYICRYTPSMLTARFNSMLRHLRTLQLSELLFPSSVSHQQNMLRHVDTQLEGIREGFQCIPQHCLDDNITALEIGILSTKFYLRAQIETGIIQGFALDNPYIPE
jgi:hypothetical protein